MENYELMRLGWVCQYQHYLITDQTVRMSFALLNCLKTKLIFVCGNNVESISQLPNVSFFALSLVIFISSKIEIYPAN